MLTFETVNELTLKVTCTGSDVLFTKAGAFIAGENAGGKNYKFEKVLLGPQNNIGQALLGQLARRVTGVDCQHFFRQIFLGYFSDIVQAFDTLRKNVCGDDYTSLHNPIVLSSVLPAYGMFHSIQILFL